MKNKSIVIIAIFFGFIMIAPKNMNAQSFFSFQSIQKHTFFFSLSWQKKVVLGAGYSYRVGSDIQFADLSIEWKAPIDEYFNGKNFELISGAFIRQTPKKPILATGYHLRINKISTDEKEGTLVGLGLTILPGYQPSAPTDDSPVSTFGARVTYVPTIYASIKDKTNEGKITNGAFAAHTVELGLHADFILKRAVGIALNPMIVNTFTSEEFTFPDTPDWDFQGNIYFGPTYRLDRN